MLPIASTEGLARESSIWMSRACRPLPNGYPRTLTFRLSSSRSERQSPGPYWQKLVCFLQSQTQPIAGSVVNPRRVRDFAKAGGLVSKTDPLDARLLVHFTETFTPPALEAQKQAYRHLRAFSRHYLQLRHHYDVIHDQRDKALADPDAPAALGESFDSLFNRRSWRGE